MGDDIILIAEEFDFRPGDSCLEGSHVPHNVNFIRAIVNAPVDLINFGFGHVVTQGKTRFGHQGNGGLADFAAGELDPERGQADTKEIILLCFLHQPVDVPDREGRTELGMFNVAGDVQR